MSAGKQPRHRREDIADRVIPRRSLFAEIVFAYFDRVGWWNDVKLPWRRLSGMVTNSEQNLERWFQGATPSAKSVDALADVLNIPARTIQYVLDHNELPLDDDRPLTSLRAQLCTAITRLNEEDCGILLIMAERLLRDRHGA